MLHHISFAAENPRHVAEVLARLIGGRVSRFGPWPGGYIAWSSDGAGTAVEVYPRGTELSPDPDGGQAQFRHNYFAQKFSASHAAISVARDEDAVRSVAQDAGWQVRRLDRGGFDVLEFWVENTTMIEVLTPAMLTQYLSVVDAPRIEVSGTDFEPVDLSVVVGADPATIFRSWTDAELLRDWWGVPQARVDLRIGGAFELFFVPDAQHGLRGSEGCRVLSYVPDRMLSFTWNTPAHLGDPRRHTWVVLQLTAQADTTVVELSHNGLDSPEAREYFRRAWRRVLHRLQERYPRTDAVTDLSRAVPSQRLDLSEVSVSGS